MPLHTIHPALVDKHRQRAIALINKFVSIYALTYSRDIGLITHRLYDPSFTDGSVYTDIVLTARTQEITLINTTTAIISCVGQRGKICHVWVDGTVITKVYGVYLFDELIQSIDELRKQKEIIDLANEIPPYFYGLIQSLPEAGALEDEEYVLLLDENYNVIELE